jgi:hypothetical protein
MARYFVPKDLVERCGRCFAWRRLNTDALSVTQGEGFRSELIWELGTALWIYLEVQDEVARQATGPLALRAPRAAAVKRTKH